MNKQLLIVDDEADLRDLLIFHLADRRIEIHTAGDGAEALAKAEAVRPDLILLDILLPDVDGLTLCEALKQATATRLVPIVVMSAHDSETTRQLARAAGAVEFFRKPFPLAAFTSAVKRLMFDAPVPQFQPCDKVRQLSAGCFRTAICS